MLVVPNLHHTSCNRVRLRVSTLFTSCLKAKTQGIFKSNGREAHVLPDGVFLGWLCDLKAVSPSGICESSEVDPSRRHSRTQISRLPTSHLWTLRYGRSKRRSGDTELVTGPFFPFPFCVLLSSFDTVWPPARDGRQCQHAAWKGKGERLRPRVGCVGAGGGQIGWEADGGGFVPSAQQKGDWRWPQAPLSH